QDSVPKPPELSTLEEFYKWFRQTEQIEDAVKSGSTSYIQQNEVQCLNNLQRGQVKYGNSIIHLGSRFVTYAQGLMALCTTPLIGLPLGRHLLNSPQPQCMLTSRSTQRWLRI
ncbi:hypothetical protein VP01_15385g1, partial [Puccinia sorghi]